MNFKTIRVWLICLASSFLTLPATAIAGAESGLYIGFGAGDTSLEEDGIFDLEDSGYKILGGYNFGAIPLVDIAVEVSYVDFGEFVAPVVGTFDVTGLSAFALVGLSFGPVGVFAKAGALSWEAESSLGATVDGTDSAYGVGARLAIGSFSVRAEYEVFELDNADLDMVSISGIYTF